ncbi:MAG TPA: diguanylate cyclase [Patescibacteria group bacterium]|jgi:diguanylate cyclase (GGDEF)-like protein
MASKLPDGSAEEPYAEFFSEVRAEVTRPTAEDVVDGILSGEISREEGVELLERWKEESREDVLTGLPNLRAFAEYTDRLNEMLDRSGRLIPLRIDSIDIRGLKWFNDRYDHEVGDEAILAVVEELQETFRRSSDYIVRVSGDEFVVVRIDDHPDDVDDEDDGVIKRLRERASERVVKGRSLELHVASAKWPVRRRPEVTLQESVIEAHRGVSRKKEEAGSGRDDE